MAKVTEATLKGRTGREDGPQELVAPARGAHGELIVQSVGVAVEILDAIASVGRPVRLAQLAETLGLPRARVHRHLKTMKELGLVWQERSGERYGLGWKLFHLGQSAAEQFEIKRLAADRMRQLRDQTDATVALSVPANGCAITLLIDTPIGTGGSHVSALEGKRLPAHATAQGRIALAFADEHVRERVLAQPLTKITDRTISERPQLDRRLAEIRSRLYDVNEGELWEGFSCFAAPVLDQDSNLHAIIGVLMLEEEAPSKRHALLIRAVQECAAAISRELSSKDYLRIGIDVQEARLFALR